MPSEGTVTINPISPAPAINQSFTVSGTFQVQPALRFKDDAGSPIAFSAPATQPRNWSFTHPGFPGAGNHTVTVTDPQTGATATVTVAVSGAAESPNDTFITGATGSITLSNGVVAAISTGGQVTFNGVAEPQTHQVTNLFYHNHVLYQLGGGDWWPYTVAAGWGAALTASASGTTVTSVAGFILRPDDTWVTLSANGKVSFNGTPDAITANVVEILWQGGVLYHKNAAGNWYDLVGGGGSGNVPSFAAAQGFFQKTFDSTLFQGSIGNWYDRGSTTTNNADGSLTVYGPPGYGYNITTAVPQGGAMNFLGQTFGGGGYFECVMKWPGTTVPQSNGGGLGWWCNTIEADTDLHGPSTQWPGQAAGYSRWYEIDFMESINEGVYGMAFHNWYSANNGPETNALPPNFFYPAGFSHTDYHTYGATWQTASPTSDGFIASTVDGVERCRCYYPYIAPGSTVPPPPVLTNPTGSPFDYHVSSGGFLDWMHIYMILGSDQNHPLTVKSCRVFQKDGSGNLPPTPSSGGGGGSPTWQATTDPTAPVSNGGPGTGPAFQPLNGAFQDMGNGQRCSTGITSVTFQSFRTGVNTIQIKPYQWNGIWRNGDTGNYLAPLTAAFVSQGRYLYLPDTPKIFSATGCPPLSPANNDITGMPPFISWWTAGAGHAPTKWGLFYEPGFDTDVGGQVYAVLNDFQTGDTFHVTANMGGRGVCRQTSWGSILDFTGERGGTIPAPYGLGWIAFNNWNITPDQIIADW